MHGRAVQVAGPVRLFCSLDEVQQLAELVGLLPIHLQFGEDQKDVDEDHKKGGQRDWRQARPVGWLAAAPGAAAAASRNSKQPVPDSSCLIQPSPGTHFLPRRCSATRLCPRALPLQLLGCQAAEQTQP